MKFSNSNNVAVHKRCHQSRVGGGLFSKSDDKVGGGLVKNLKKLMTSFTNGPNPYKSFIEGSEFLNDFEIFGEKLFDF